MRGPSAENRTVFIYNFWLSFQLLRRFLQAYGNLNQYEKLFIKVGYTSRWNFLLCFRHLLSK